MLMYPNLPHLVFLLVLVMAEGSAHSVAPLTVPRQGKGALPVFAKQGMENQVPLQPHKQYPVGEADTPCLLQSGKE